MGSVSWTPSLADVLQTVMQRSEILQRHKPLLHPPFCSASPEQILSYWGLLEVNGLFTQKLLWEFRRIKKNHRKSPM